LGEITAPSGLRGLIEAVHGETARAVPPPLELREIEAEGAGMAARGHAAQNIVDFAAGYRLGGRGDDDASYPTRLGEEQQVLVLARHGEAGLQPWADGPEGWALSEVSASRKRLARFDLPDQNVPEIAAVTRDWPDWKQAALRICPVAEDGTICPGLHYTAEWGLVFRLPGSVGDEP
ncbi:MAG: CRISPR-associated helicase/endonuclease Cas3, partial [Paracoccaceae bacterium]